MLVLVVEDDAVVACAAADALSDAGHEVLGPALEVEEALRLVRERRPDLAMVDINLAGDEEGVALARRLRDQHGVSSLFVSGQVAAARSNQDAALGLLSKPYDPATLAAAVPIAGELMAGRRPPPPPVPHALELFV
jgi:DNA-binding response OmpR family regulator